MWITISTVPSRFITLAHYNEGLPQIVAACGPVFGFAQAMALRPDSWAAMGDGDDADAVDAFLRLSTLIAIARNQSSLDSFGINAMHDGAPAVLVATVLRLHAWRLRNGNSFSTVPPGARPTKVRGNEPASAA